jgi:nitric oxide reductase NorE protein
MGSAVARPGARAVTRRTTHVPGEAGIWLLVLAEMSVFSVFFVVFALDRSRHLGEFEQSRGALHVAFGLANTLLLLASSYIVARGVAGWRAGEPAAPRRFAWGALCGLGFLADKVVEYCLEVAQGYTPATNDFFRYFYAYTAVHAVHVGIGVVLLTYIWRITSLDLHERAIAVRRAESVATFWHMVDLIWVVLFALLYLI